MRVLIQRVREAQVSIALETVAKINKGYLLLVGVGCKDTPQDALWMAEKISSLRIFEDAAGKLNLDIHQVQGEILSVPQFTLCADLRQGNRPGFDDSAKPALAEELWRKFNQHLRSKDIKVQEGKFGAHMEVQLVNDGPVTIWIDSEKPSQ